jgi:glycosyltransferase involved in cell wall biosynthesis
MSASVSVVIPTCGRPAMLVEAIESALAQTRPPAEIIVATSDPVKETEAVVGKLGRPVVVMRSAAPGPSAARNRGIERARGMYVAFLDDDDLWHPEKLAVQMEFLEAHPEVAMVSSRVVPFGAEILIRRGPWVTGDLYPRLFMESFVATPSVVVRRDVFERVGGFDLRYMRAEDYDLWLRIADGFITAHLKAPLAWFRKAPTRLSENKVDLRRSAISILGERYNPAKVSRRRYRKRMSDLLVFLGREEAKAGDVAGARRHFVEAAKLTPVRLRPLRYLIGTVFK